MAKWTYRAVVIHTDASKPDKLAVDGNGRPELFGELNYSDPDELQKRLSANGLNCESVKVTIETIKPPAAQ